MKKKFISGILILLLIAAAVPQVFAGTQFVFDQGEILSDSEISELEEEAGELSEEYGCNVYVVTIPEFSSQSDSLRDVSKNFYQDNQLGCGEGKDGIMLLLSMQERQYWLLGYGDFANTAMTDYGREVMEQEFVDDFRDDDWFGGFEDYLDQAEFYLESAAEGKPFDVDTPVRHPVKAYGIGLGVSAIVGIIVCLVFYFQMNTAGQKVSASAYVPTDGGVDFRKRLDIFTHTTTQRVKIENDSDSSGSSSGGGGTSVDSDGFSGSGGSF